MIVVREISPGAFERPSGNPTLLSLDGTVKAPLRTILAPSWTPEERAKFGVYVVEPFVTPDGMARVGMPTYSKDQDGRVVETYATEQVRAPEPDPLDVLRADVDALTARVAALEGKA